LDKFFGHVFGFVHHNVYNMLLNNLVSIDKVQDIHPLVPCKQSIDQATLVARLLLDTVLQETFSIQVDREFYVTS
jgi:hypothetical protein